MVNSFAFSYDKYSQITFGSVAELVDAPDLKSVDHIDREGSSPSLGTILSNHDERRRD